MSRRLWRVAAIGLTCAVVVACLLPADDLPQVPGNGFDKLQHLFAFVLLGFCWHRSGAGLYGTLAVGLLLAAGTEVGQTLMREGRTGEVLDALADLAGLLVGVGVSWWLGRCRAAASRA